jgi:hypothetical protein
VKTSLLAHNETSSLVRRPSGLADEQWDELITHALVDFMTVKSKDKAFMRCFVDALIDLGHSFLLKKLGIDDAKKSYQNWEHTAFRFFRHFCPEDLRNALSHSGLKFATLEYRKTGLSSEFYWESAVEFETISLSPILENFGVKLGDKVETVATGKGDIQSVTISRNGSDVFSYYDNSKGGKQFGRTMYMLKKMLLANKVKRR